MADQQAGNTTAVVETKPTPVKTAGAASRDAREATRKAREAKAARRFAARNGDASEPKAEEETAEATESQPAAEAKTEPETKADPTKAELAKRHAIAERRERRIVARESKLKEREDKTSRAEHNLRATYGDPDEAKKAYNAGQFHEAAKYIQRIFGDDFGSITQKIARATAGLSPEKLKELEERDNFAREKREWEASKKKAEEEKATGTTREKALTHVSEKCKGHDVLKLKNGADLVLRTLEKHWKTDHFTITFKQAADLVLKDKLEEAEALGLKRHSAKLVEKKPEPVVERATPKRGGYHREPAEKPKGRLSFEERHATAGRLLAKRRAQ